MIDFHTHILPGVDDGSRHLTDSLEMLRMEQRQGVDLVALTPHFYSSQQSPEKFLERRERAWQRLLDAWEEGMPQLLLGAEVQYFDSIENLSSLSSLCIQGTSLLLLEMPFAPWEQRVIRAVQEIQEFGEIQVVLAHIDRYLSCGDNHRLLESLRRSGVLMQVNASFFEGWFHRRKALSMFRKGEFQLLGSDCHNLDARKPNWASVPEDVKQSVSRNSRKLLKQYQL